MELVLTMLAAMALLWYFLKIDADWVSLRIEMLAMMFGVCYKPGKWLSFAIAVALFYLIFVVVIGT